MEKILGVILISVAFISSLIGFVKENKRIGEF